MDKRKQVTPKPTLENRIEHRFFVRQKDKIDKKHRARLGLDTFPDDWERLHKTKTRSGVKNRTIWLFWLQGYDNAPPLVRACINSWRAFNPDWNLVVLDESSIHDYVEIPKLPKQTTPNHFANILRLRLLFRHGGVWVDATTLCTQPLDEWVHIAAKKGFFAFRQPQPTRALATWFLVANPENVLTRTWLIWSEIYIRSIFRPKAYHWVHHTFDWLLLKNSTLKSEWDNVPRLSARGPHVMQRILDGHLRDEDVPTKRQIEQIPMFKMSWKKGYTIDDIERVLQKYRD